MWIGPLVAALATAPSPEVPVAVAGIEFTGDPDPRRRAAFDQALEAGLGAGHFAVFRLEPRPCAETRCFAEAANSGSARHVLRVRVSIAEHDYRYTIELFARGNDEPVATADDRCELCGAREAVDAFAGAVAAMRDRVDALQAAAPRLLLRTDPTGATVTIDGRARGRTPVDIELVPGAHVVTFTRPGYRPRELRITSVAGVIDRHSVALVAVPIAKPRRGALAAGATVLGLGLGAVAAGAALTAIDGEPRRRDCRADVDGRCHYTYRTLPGGIATLTAGIVGVIVGATVTGVIERKRRRQ